MRALPRVAPSCQSGILAGAATVSGEAVEQGMTTSSAPWPRAMVKLRPASRAQAEVDRQAVEEVFAMEVSDESQCARRRAGLKVSSTVPRTASSPFRRLEPNERVVSPGRRDSGTAAPPEALDAGPREPMGNPFGGV